MGNIVWEEKYDVGVNELNQQHKKLIETLNHLYVAMENKQDRHALKKVLMELIEYIKVHFATEEDYMFKYFYPEYISHKEEHQKFIKKVVEFCNDFKDDKLVLYFDIAVFLKNWIFSHISETDKKYGAFLNSKGVK